MHVLDVFSKFSVFLSPGLWLSVLLDKNLFFFLDQWIKTFH